MASKDKQTKRKGRSSSPLRGAKAKVEVKRHASKSLNSNRTGTTLFKPRYEEPFKKLREPGATLTGVAKDAGVSRGRLSEYIKTVAGARRDGKIWRFDDRRIRRMAIIEADEEAPVMVRVPGFEGAHRAGLHRYEAGLALRHRERRPEFIRRWEGQRIRDVDGRWHTLSTNFPQIFRAILTQDYSFERFYAIEH